MKPLKFLTLGIALITAITFNSCKKEGIGGYGEIRGYAISNGKMVKPFIFYISYGATSSPGGDLSKYDSSSLSDDNGKFNFKGLKKGDYYIYAKGTENGSSMAGGAHIFLNQNEILAEIPIAVN